MVSLLPGAGQTLSFSLATGSLVTLLDGKPITTVTQRMDVFRKRYGQRFAEGRLEDFVRGRFEVGPDIDLLVLRAVEIDSHLENNPDTAPTEITNALKRIRVAIHKLIEQGFHEVVIATDHGFFMNTHAGAGDICPKPPGNWSVVHDRCLVGDGQADANHYLMPAERLGMRGDVPKLAGPLSLAAYTNGLLYYHGGVSLQECVVPVIVVKLHGKEQPAAHAGGDQPELQEWRQEDHHAGAGDRRVGQRRQHVLHGQQLRDPARSAGPARARWSARPRSAAWSIPRPARSACRPGEKAQVPLRMQLEFEGKFTVKALNPTTN